MYGGRGDVGCGCWRIAAYKTVMYSTVKEGPILVECCVLHLNPYMRTTGETGSTSVDAFKLNYSSNLHRRIEKYFENVFSYRYCI